MAGAALLSSGLGHRPPATQAMAVPCAAGAGDGTLLITGRAPGASGVTLFAADPARAFAPRALVRALPADTTLGPSPRGRYVALAEGARGLWLVNSDGTGLRLLLPAPPTTRAPGPTGAYYVTAVTWSPDRYTLAYAISQFGEYPRYSVPPSVAPDGIWLVRYDGGTPRLLASGAQLGVNAIAHLSYSADGRTLAAAAAQGRSAVILAVAAATGRATHLFAVDANVDDAAYSPVAPRLLYRASVFVPVPGQPDTEDAEDGVFVADARGRRRTLLVRTSSTSIQNPVWSPDGRRVAYLWAGSSAQVPDEVHAVDVTTDRVRTLAGMTPQQQFMSLAWMHCRA